MQINVETKFEVGQEVFLIKKQKKVIETKATCDICFGTGSISYKGYDMSCPKCHGNRNIVLDSKDLMIYVIEDSCKNTSCRYMITQKESCLYYKINGRNGLVPENEIFATQEEAETRCNELNKEVTTNGNR